MEKEPRQALFDDVIDKLLEWKTEDCEIILTGGFNQNVYQNQFAWRLAEDNINMTEQILKTTGKKYLQHMTEGGGQYAVCMRLPVWNTKQLKSYSEAPVWETIWFSSWISAPNQY